MDEQQVITLSSALGIISSTLFFTMNHTINYLTMPTIMLGAPPKPGTKPSVNSFVPSSDVPAATVDQLNREWQEIYARGHLVGPPSAIITGVAFLTAAYYHGKPLNQKLFVAAAVAAMSVMPYTIVVMFPKNNRLHERGEVVSGRKESKKVLGEADTMALIKSWVGNSKIRANMAVVAATLGLLGLVL